ncbi:hypothetical protein DAEQUDRAFT_809156 [Daedalea quercina L-15889]|uniref:Nephrocystin 3-like N-terminal domain-containing protein n=1 Tax=Daedalea quercina L-15889 TaxID=1314783 RepID=A0A165SNH0_9APHY|nr:hypothetical protein DAEQUDRAFT_809156 [Daedalea quercina L-15889]
MTSSSTRKLKSIISDLERNADNISETASIIKSQLDAREHYEAQKERSKADAERAHQSEWRKKQSAANYLDICGHIHDTLDPGEASKANTNRHESNLQRCQKDTCRWLSEDPMWSAWSNPSRSLGPPESIFCLSGPVGYGKTILTSFAISELQQTHGVAVAYYFCQFSQPCETMNELLYIFALQLFDVYFARKLPVDEDLYHRVLHSKSTSQPRELLRELCINLRPVYIFIDGLDEAQQGNSQQTLTLTLKLICDELLGDVRLWTSKRRQTRPVDCYDAVIRPLVGFELEIEDHTEADVVRYIRTRFAALEKRFEHLSDEDRALFRFAENYLTSRAKGHFLWAWLMTKDFEGEDRVEDVRELLRRLFGPPPRKLDSLYKEIFSRIKEPNRKIASKVMSLIAFSRRELRIEEVREAALLVLTRGKKNAKDDGLSGMEDGTFFSKFTVLVEVSKGSAHNSESVGYCRLVHSSVLEFLAAHPKVLGGERAVHISPYPMADACLLYLMRPIYKNLLRRQLTGSGASEWVDNSGRSTTEHQFLYYAAKYWARHLEGVEPEPPLRKRVEEFVESTSFQTCMQVQTIWIEGMFNVYSVQGRTSLLRIFPDWFIRAPAIAGGKTPTISKHWMHYLRLAHDWRYLLSCGNCYDIDPDCPFIPFRGEIDRLWWASLGPEHIFSGFHSRYASFSMAQNDERCLMGRGDRFEALYVTLDQFAVIRLSRRDHKSRTLEFTCETWSSDNTEGLPTVQRRQLIRASETTINWNLYCADKHDDELRTRLVARPLMFTETGEYLRIGAQLYRLKEDHEYHPLQVSFSTSADERPPGYFEEFANRGVIVALGSRAYSTSKELLEPYRVEEGFGEDYLRFEGAPSEIHHGQRPGHADVVDDEDDSMSGDCQWEDVSSVTDDAEGYESWSEGSTEDEAVIVSDDDSGDEDSSIKVSLSSDDSDTQSDSESEAPGDVDPEAEPSESSSFSGSQIDDHELEDDLDSGSESSEDPSLPPSLYRNYVPDSDDEEDGWGRTIGALLRDRSRRGAPLFKENASDTSTSINPRMLLVIFDTSGSVPKKVFQYTHPLSFMLYASPPAIHPQNSLVAWPLGGGDVLFADFVAKTYFTRKVRPSATQTRNLCMKLHFHPGGSFLHIASLEAQVQFGQNDQESSVQHDRGTTPPMLTLSVLLSTYRLSSRKTTRSPPLLIHRIKVKLGRYAKLTVSRLPATFTWTESDLYVSQSASELSVFRIPLFAGSTSGQNVLVPERRMFLPSTAESRDVHFVPAVNSSPARLILGSESSSERQPHLDMHADPIVQVLTAIGASVRKQAPSHKLLSTPVGCLLAEEDIGRWVKAEDVPVPQGQGVGKLDQRRERFDPVDDCDVEPYLRFT